MPDAAKTLQVRPACLAMVIADRAHRDPATGKHTILGTFSYLHLADLPSSFPALAVYCVLSGGRGDIPFCLDLVEAADEGENALRSVAGIVTFKNPHDVAECLFEFQQLHFPRAGEYRLRLRCAGEVVMERRLDVHGGERKPKEADLS